MIDPYIQLLTKMSFPIIVLLTEIYRVGATYVKMNILYRKFDQLQSALYQSVYTRN